MISNKLHLAVQQKIASLLRGEKIFLEYKCQKHIADIFWEKRRLVFEVQCSPMNLRECKKRTKDLEKQGMKVVWILHEKSFNKKYLSPMEHYLRRKKRCFFTNIDQGGRGIIYDQEEVIYFQKRIKRSPPSPLDLSLPKSSSKRTFFPGAITHQFFPTRYFANMPLWHIKFFFKKKALQKKWRYFAAYFQWKIRL